jgi:hypothetical protein
MFCFRLCDFLQVVVEDRPRLFFFLDTVPYERSTGGETRTIKRWRRRGRRRRSWWRPGTASWRRQRQRWRGEGIVRQRRAKSIHR